MSAEQFLTSAGLCKKLGNLKQTEDEKIEVHFVAAKDDVIGIIGQVKYTEMLAASATDKDRIRIATAESYFVLSYTLPSINLSSSGDGIKSATGYGESRQNNLSQSELAMLIDNFRNTAERLLSNYREKKDITGDENPDIVSTAHLKLISI